MYFGLFYEETGTGFTKNYDVFIKDIANKDLIKIDYSQILPLFVNSSNVKYLISFVEIFKKIKKLDGIDVTGLKIDDYKNTFKPFLEISQKINFILTEYFDGYIKFGSMKFNLEKLHNIAVNLSEVYESKNAFYRKIGFAKTYFSFNVFLKNDVFWCRKM